MVFDTFSSKEHEILTGTVLRIEPATNDMTIRIGGGNDKTDAMLSASEQVRTEYYHEGDLIRVYVVEVRRSTKGPQVIVSRTHPGLVKRLFELEVPEIASGASSCVRTVRRGSACAHSAATQSRRHTQKRRRNGVGIIALNFTAK